jgi:adenosylmethionine-8-amino-7-oxononanoate aminotransferase
MIQTPGGTQDVFYSRAATAILPLITRASGIRMWDEDGKSYIDSSSGPMVSCLGHGNERVIEAMSAQAHLLDYAFTYVARNRPNADLAARLASLAGPGFERVAFASGGSEAMDRALQLARQYAVAMGQPSRRTIITLEPSYHGATIAASAISGDQTRTAFFQGFAITSHTIRAPLPYRRPPNQSLEDHFTSCAAALEQKIEHLGAENVLAFVIEPIGGVSRGAVVPSDGYMRAIREICSRHGVLLIFDEIITGIGRTGPLFAMSHWPDAKPDILIIAKALGAGYAPIGAMLAPAALVDQLADRGGFEYAYSYNAHPIACAAALTVLSEIEERKLLFNARGRAVQLEQELKALLARVAIIGDIRGRGLYWAVEIVRDRATKEMLPQDLRPTDRIRNHGLKHGVMLYARATSQGRYGHWFTLAPPLTITEGECAEMLQRVESALISFEAELRTNNMIQGARRQ